MGEFWSNRSEFEMMPDKARKKGPRRMLKRTSALSVGERRHRYQPPSIVKSVSIKDLIEGSPRAVDQTLQLNLMDTLTSRGDGVQGRLFVAGDTKILKTRCISVIGTRNLSEEGAARARRLAKELVKENITVVSGLAHGVDTFALQSAIDHGGQVVAVIGTPLAQAYPASNAHLQEEIYRNHLLISQFAEGSRVFTSNFPARNRTMAFLSDASVIIEASDTSGTLHQATECVRLGRWLCIAQSVVDNKSITWPARFRSYSKCLVLSSTEDLIEKVYFRES